MVAVVVGIALGVLLGRRPTLRRMASPVIEFLRAIPAPALIPFAILVLGVDNDAKIFLIAVVCFFPVLLNAIDGVAGIEPTLLDTTTVYRIGAFDRLRYVILPAAAPQIFAGIRTSLSLSLILMVISEMVASSNGIGYFILQSQRTFAITEMWSGILLLGLLGYLFNVVFTLVERRVLAWHYRRARAGARELMLEVTNLSKTYGTGGRDAGDRRPVVRGRAGRVRLHRRPVGLRQDDAAEDDVRPAARRRAARSARRQARHRGRRSDGAGLPGLQPVAVSPG